LLAPLTRGCRKQDKKIIRGQTSAVGGKTRQNLGRPRVLDAAGDRDLGAYGRPTVFKDATAELSRANVSCSGQRLPPALRLPRSLPMPRAPLRRSPQYRDPRWWLVPDRRRRVQGWLHRGSCRRPLCLTSVAAAFAQRRERGIRVDNEM
jgi:hypothetical protein